MKNYLEIKNLDYSVNSEHILNDVNFNINKKGEIVCLLGPSGIGKTTILRSIAGLIKPRNGKITLKGFVPNTATPIRLTVVPNTLDIAPVRNQLLNIDQARIETVVEVDTVAVSGTSGTIDYNTNSRIK